MSERALAMFMVISLTVASGFADAQGFVHAANMWRDSHLVGRELAKSGVGFGLGIVSYWIALRFLDMVGAPSPVVQTTMWFALTIAGVAIISGDFFRWQMIDQAVAIAVLGGIGLLFVRGLA